MNEQRNLSCVSSRSVLGGCSHTQMSPSGAEQPGKSNQLFKTSPLSRTLTDAWKIVLLVEIFLVCEQASKNSWQWRGLLLGTMYRLKIFFYQDYTELHRLQRVLIIFRAFKMPSLQWPEFSFFSGEYFPRIYYSCMTENVLHQTLQ